MKYLGTASRLIKNADPIHGVGMLLGEDPDLVLLSVRVPPEFSALVPFVIAETMRTPPLN